MKFGKNSKILLCMTALAACFMIGIACGEDGPEGQEWLGTESVSGSDRSMIMDEGIRGMVRWMDRPVPNFPWYTVGGSFYTEGYNESTFSSFTEYYVTSDTTVVVDGIVSDPTTFNITQKTPSVVYYGAGVGLPYAQYAATVPSETNDLWILGATNWTQYVVSPVGTWLQLVAYAPVEGPAGFYEMIQTNTTDSRHKTYQFNQGYNTMNFNADQVGRHMLYFVVNNQPSNVVIVDVFAQALEG